MITRVTFWRKILIISVSGQWPTVISYHMVLQSSATWITHIHVFMITAHVTAFSNSHVLSPQASLMGHTLVLQVLEQF